jgi:tripartite-type tricarboxylate transporter receptor subunit TctC
VAHRRGERSLPASPDRFKLSEIAPPQPIIDRLNREIVSVVATADYKNMIENAGSIAASSTPRQLGDVIAQTLDEVAATMQEFGPPQKQ